MMRLAAGSAPTLWGSARARTGGRSIEQEALASLYARFGPVVFRRARALLRDEDAARDALQEVFLKVLARHHTFRGEADILHWIYRITTNHCLNVLRRRRAWPEAAPGAIDQLVRGGEAEVVDRSAVLSVLAQVDARTQQVAVYYYFDEMRMEEVAAHLGVTRKTVSRCLERFRRRAAARLGGGP